MNPEDFLKEFDDAQLPNILGPMISIDWHDPPFKKGDLRRMAKQGFIVLDDVQWTYRLTMKATELYRTLHISNHYE